MRALSSYYGILLQLCNWVNIRSINKDMHLPVRCFNMEKSIWSSKNMNWSTDCISYSINRKRNHFKCWRKNGVCGNCPLGKAKSHRIFLSHLALLCNCVLANILKCCSCFLSPAGLLHKLSRNERKIIESKRSWKGLTARIFCLLRVPLLSGLCELDWC